METRTCTGCNQELPATSEFFHKEKLGRDGLRSKCIPCRKKDNDEWVKNNPEKVKEKRKRHRDKHGEKLNARSKQWREENKPHVREYINRRYREDVSFRISMNLRSRIGDVMRGKTKSSSSMDLLGCTAEECKKHLEDQFQEGMSWDNYGNPEGEEGWHMDHIRPCASFDLTQEDQQRVCFHYTNLQPLWAKENLSKGDKWEEK
jgi:hypothetical protein